MNEFVGHLSGGQRQIIALLSILHQGSKIICLDEFVSALDDKSEKIAIQILTHCVREFGISILLVSHTNVDIQFNRAIELN